MARTSLLVSPKKMLKLNLRPVYCSQLYGIQDYSYTNVCFLDRCSKWKRKFQVWCTTTKYSILWDWNSSRQSIFRRSLQGVCNSNRYYVKKSLNFICSTYFSNPSKEDFIELIQNNFKLINEKFNKQLITSMSKNQFKNGLN